MRGRRCVEFRLGRVQKCHHPEWRQLQFQLPTRIHRPKRRTDTLGHPTPMLSRELGSRSVLYGKVVHEPCASHRSSDAEFSRRLSEPVRWYRELWRHSFRRELPNDLS